MTTKRFIFLILLMAFAISMHAQPLEYTQWVQKAKDFYTAKQYQQSADAFSRAFAAFGGKGFMGDRYNAACSWTLAGNKDSAFFNLMRIATKSDFTGVSQLQQDNDLTALHADKRWDELMAIVQQNKDKAEGSINRALAAELDTIMNDDQDDRRRAEEVGKKYGPSSKEVKELWTVISRKDSVNLIKVKAILDKYGWVGPDVAGRQGNMTIFLVIQHADLKTQEHYLPMMRAAVKDKKAEPFSLAMLEDRVALRTGKKQIYGSQIGTRADGTYYVDDLEDPDNVDKRRAEVGLGPIAEYVQHWELTWDVAAYKKQLPEIEKMHKDKMSN